MTAVLNVRDECDLPEDDGYDLFTRETEVERHREDEPQSGTKRRDGRSAGDGRTFPAKPTISAGTYGAK